MLILQRCWSSHSRISFSFEHLSLAENRPTVIKEKPDLTFGEVGKELGARWRALSDEEKAEWKAKPE